MNAAVSVIDAVNRLASIDVSIVRWLPLVLVHLKTSSLAPLRHRPKWTSLTQAGVHRNLLRVASSCVLRLARIWQTFFRVPQLFRVVRNDRRCQAFFGLYVSALN